MFSCEFSEIFKNAFFHRTPPVAASEKLKTEGVVRRCSVKKVFLEILLNSQYTIVFEWTFISITFAVFEYLDTALATKNKILRF